MTNDENLDEFEQETFGPTTSAPKNGGGLKESLAEAWRTQPLFKLMVIMIVVGVAIAGALGVFSGPPPADKSKIQRAPDLNEPPGGKSSHYFIEQNQQANEQRANQAMQQGGSALPTPVGQNLDLGDLTGQKKEDPLAEFRAETERLKQEMTQERQQNQQQIQVLQQQVQMKPPPAPEDDSLAQAMQKQMQQLMESWVPRAIKVVDGPALKDSEKEKVSGFQQNVQQTQVGQPSASAASVKAAKTIVQAGTVNYAQMLIEANSDIPGPILAQVLSGPFSGGRAIGSFRTMNDFLVIQFNNINYKGKDYPVHVLALDPDTTLGGLVTEVDHRYLDRILLPAAAQFASTFGSTLAQGKSDTAIVTNNAVISLQAEKGYKEALFSGLGQAGQSVAQFLQQEASQIKPLVRVAAGTPMGLFFLTSVKESADGSPIIEAGGGLPFEAAEAGSYPGMPGGALPPSGYVAQPYGVAPPGANPYASSGYYNPAYPTTSYPTGYSPMGYQRMPSSNVTITGPGQSGLGVNYFNR